MAAFKYKYLFISIMDAYKDIENIARGMGVYLFSNIIQTTIYCCERYKVTLFQKPTSSKGITSEHKLWLIYF